MLRLEKLTKTYKTGNSSVVALDGVSLQLPPGSFTALLGRSGCGKTTLLRLIAGLEKPDSGRLACAVPQRNIGYVFQEARLMPWLTVEENIRFAAAGRRGGIKKPGDPVRIMQTLGLAAFAEALPHQLSGGMAQRVALGRTLFCSPGLILMDEPFGALDWFTRRALQQDLLRLWQEGGKNILFVTHDIDEALSLADRVVILSKGKIVDRFVIDGGYPRKPAELLLLRERILSATDGTDEKTHITEVW